MSNPYIVAVRTIWERRGIQNRTAAAEADIAEFEEKYSVRLPLIVREYFRELNGTNEGELGMDDEHLIGFWHLNQIRPMKEECPEYVTPDEPNLFIFADYSIWALGYAIRLAPDGRQDTAIFLIGGHRPLRIAPTFEAFLQGYAEGNQSMLFGQADKSNSYS